MFPPARLRSLFLACLLSLLTGCATFSGMAAKPVKAYDLRILARLSAEHPQLSRQRVQKLIDIEQRIEAAAGLRVDHFLLVETSDVNAAATIREGKTFLLIHRPILDRIGDDDAALAALIGHEVAHLALGHVVSRRNLNQAVSAGTQVLAVLASMAVPGGGYLVGMGGNAISRAYSREQERESDKAGLDYAVKAGYNPLGVLRLFKALPVGNENTGFFDSHPGKAERIGYIQELIREKYGEMPKDITPQAE